MADKFKVFISWSGELSKAVATVWRDLVVEVIDGVTPFMSELDIGAGERGLTVIAKELEDTRFGIVVVTQENEYSQWLNYEAGALSKNVGDEPVRVAPSLVDFEKKGDATGPLSQFQRTLLTEEGVGEILDELAKVVVVDRTSVAKRFRRAWHDEYQQRFEQAKTESGPTRSSNRGTEAMLDEILTLVRDIARTSKPTVSLTKTAQPSKAAVREAMIAVLGDDFRWRARVEHRGVDITLPVELPADIDQKLTLALGNVPYVDFVTVRVAPNHFIDDPEPELD